MPDNTVFRMNQSLWLRTTHFDNSNIDMTKQPIVLSFSSNLRSTHKHTVHSNRILDHAFHQLSCTFLAAVIVVVVVVVASRQICCTFAQLFEQHWKWKLHEMANTTKPNEMYHCARWLKCDQLYTCDKICIPKYNSLHCFLCVLKSLEREKGSWMIIWDISKETLNCKVKTRKWDHKMSFTCFWLGVKLSRISKFCRILSTQPFKCEPSDWNK